MRILYFKSIVFRFVIAIALLGLLYSCEDFDGDQTIPAYIQLDKFTLTKNSNLAEGSLSHKITDVWVYVDDQLIGAFELPARFPVLKKGKHKITLAPGIKMNGMSGTRVVYPFYKRIEITDSILVEGKILHLDSTVTVTSYSDNAKFAWKEDFEDGGVSLQKRTGSDTSIYATSVSGNVFEGFSSGLIYLNETQDFYEIETINKFVLPKNASPVFLEMNYKTNNPIRIGLLAYYSSKIVQTPTIVLNPTTEWKKIYINFTPDISDSYSALDYKVFFGEYKNSTNTTATILFDNIKLVHW